MIKQFLQQFFQNPAWGFALAALMGIFLTPWLFAPAILFYSLFLLKVLPREHPRKGVLDNLGLMLIIAGMTIYGHYYFLTDGYLLTGDVAKARLAFMCGFQDRVNQVFDKGSTPLHYAAERGNEEMIDFLIDNGAKIDARNSAGSTPLFMAGYFQRWKCVQKLLDRGANRNIRNKYGYLPNLWRFP